MTSISPPNPVAPPRARTDVPTEDTSSSQPQRVTERDVMEQMNQSVRQLRKALGPFGFMVPGLRPPAPAARGAVQAQAPVSKPWRGPTILTPISRELKWDQRKAQYENIEQFYLRNNDNKGVLVPWKSFDSTKQPLILVHGITDSASWIEDLADHFHDQGKQVYLLMYDDTRTNPDASGQQLAEQMQKIRRQYYGKDTKLEIVGHSLGALVSRAALNSLQKPDWLYGPNNTRPEPRAGFSDVSFLALDAPWAGVSGAINRLKLWYGVNHMLEDFTSLNNVTATDNLMTRMQSVPLPGVKMVYARATSRGDDFLPDNEHTKQFESLWANAMPKFKEYDHPPIAQLAEFVMTEKVGSHALYYRNFHPAHRNTYGHRDTDMSVPEAFPPPWDSRLANIGRAIRNDHRVGALRAELRREWVEIRKSGKRGYAFNMAMSHAFQKAYAKHMPPINGNHATIINDTETIDGLLEGMR